MTGRASRRFVYGVALAALALGAASAWVYWRAGLTLSHYDAKAHLVVARRIIDSITPGWQQIGAVWLPLPHLLNVLPVQVDSWYRTGASAIALSVAALGGATAAIAALMLRATAVPAAAAASAAIFVLNPNVLYLHATPMTEPLLLLFTTLSVWLVYEWVERDARPAPRGAGWAMAAACLTRYEAWLVTAGTLALAWCALWRKGRSAPAAARPVAGLALYPLAAIGAFHVLSRATTGVWFVTDGFFVPDNPAMHDPIRAASLILWGTHRLTGAPVVAAALLGLVAVATVAVRSRARAPVLVLLALAAPAALPLYAFVQGHPFRIRYMVPMVPAAAVLGGFAVSVLTQRWQTLAAAALAAWLVVFNQPFDFSAPMVREAQLDRRNSAGRRLVTEYLEREYRREKILMSMGSLAHYMHELGQVGLSLREFVHEGNGDIWKYSLMAPSAHVGWVVIEERAEGGDILAARARTNPGFLDGFRRVREGGGVALYECRRVP